MKSLLAGTVLAGTILAGIGIAKAIVVQIDPFPSGLTVGDTFDVDIVASGGDFDEPLELQAYELNISGLFNLLKVKGDPPTQILQVTNISFAGALGTGSDVTPTIPTLPSDGPTFSETSSLSQNDLSLLQPDSYDLATISFEAIAAGLATPRLNIVSLQFSDGSFATKIKSTLGQKVLVQEQGQLPEPESYLILLTGLAGLIGASKLPFLRRFLPKGGRA